MMTREMNYTESMALAKEQEEALLFRAMQSEAVSQVMRRLAAVRLPS
jgi:LPS-assembly lipoprotein